MSTTDAINSGGMSNVALGFGVGLPAAVLATGGAGGKAAQEVGKAAVKNWRGICKVSFLGLSLCTNDPKDLRKDLERKPDDSMVKMLNKLRKANEKQIGITPKICPIKNE